MKKIAAIYLVLSVFSTGTAFAQAGSADAQSMQSLLESMKTEMTRMHETIELQNKRLEELELKVATEKPQSPVTLQPATSQTSTQAVTAQPKTFKDQLYEAVPWLKGAKFGGDTRLRYETFDYFDKNNDAGSTGTAADRSRNRFRVRLRWGFEKDYGDDWKVGFRFVTGSTTDQVSTNQTLGNSGYFTFKNIQFDRVYASYQPSALANQGPIENVKVTAGKFENPFERYSTPIVWDPDVAPEGIYEQANFKLGGDETTQAKAQVTAAQFILNEGTAVESDASLFGYQGALTVSTKAFGTAEPVDFTVAASFYDYTNWFQTVTSNSTGVSYLRTNTILADDFRVLDIYPEIQLNINHTPVTLWYDYAANLANVGTEDLAQSGGNNIHDMDTAWGTGLKVGKLKKKGDWMAHYGYFEIGANAVVAAFNDSDFGGPGQVGATNRIGHKFGVGYQLTDNISANLTAFLVRPLNPSTLVASSSNEDVFRSQADLNFKF